MRAGEALLAWYERHRRDLPWRSAAESAEGPDPYRVWLSEIMLQQTRVETVIPYYERFLTRFPTVAALAAAPVEEVLARWSGLGYYRRARQLHAAAGQIVERGGFPRTPEALRQLPGIGDYTAAAVASIAFGVAVPVMDGNVERVTSRYLALAGDPKKRAVRSRLIAAAAGLLDDRRPGDSNQALMELGATLCSPQRPKCLLCPLADDCRAARAGEPERYPTPRKRRPVERVDRLLAWVEDERGVLLFRRPDDSTLLAGTWELPWIDRPAPVLTAAGDGAASRADEAALARRYGGRWTLAAALGSVRHGITHRAIVAEIRRCRVTSDEVVAEGPEAGWFVLGRVAELATSSLVDKAVAAVRAGRAASPP
jgi:A/G-specific adenine glycosylase